MDLALVRNYVQTLTNGEVCFPGMVSRPWGRDFSRSEQERICQTLLMMYTEHHRILFDLPEPTIKPDNLHWFVMNLGPKVTWLIGNR